MTYNLFAQPRYKASGRRAQDLNTIDEVPDSSWFTNRIGTKALTVDANKFPTASFDERWSAMSALPSTPDTAERRLEVR